MPNCQVSNERAGRLESMRVVPFPEPGKWYLGFQAHCVERRSNATGPCPKSLEAAMVGATHRRKSSKCPSEQ